MNYESTDAIEALQAENSEVKRLRDSWQKEATELLVERDKLQAELQALREQKPCESLTDVYLAPTPPVREPVLATTGEVLGSPHPDWPEWCTTFNERKAYQQGVADARALMPVREPLTDAHIIGIAKTTQSAEPGRDGYILPISFARAVLAAARSKT